jgi:hypothetical protein
VTEEVPPKVPPISQFRPLLWELWNSKNRPGKWPQEAARKAWEPRWPNLQWPAMSVAVWQNRLKELHRNPRPPEIDPERLAARIQRLRIPPLILDPLYAGGRRPAIWPPLPDPEHARALIQAEIELATLLREGPPKRKRRRRQDTKTK